jgi:hypothetical protein
MIEGGNAGRRIIEVAFESPEALMEFIQEYSEAIVNCTAFLNDQIIDLKELSGYN